MAKERLLSIREDLTHIENEWSYLKESGGQGYLEALSEDWKQKVVPHDVHLSLAIGTNEPFALQHLILNHNNIHIQEVRERNVSFHPSPLGPTLSYELEIIKHRLINFRSKERKTASEKIAVMIKPNGAITTYFSRKELEALRPRTVAYDHFSLSDWQQQMEDDNNIILTSLTRLNKLFS